MRSWRNVSVLIAFVVGIRGAQVPQSKAPAKLPARRANELTLARLRPGRDTLLRAIQLYRKPNGKSESGEAQFIWVETCQKQTLSMDVDEAKRIQVIRTMETEGSLGDCVRVLPGPWRTGRGLRVGDPATKTAQLYGEPDSKSPSSRGGHQLELWYYAFDWAGAEVPQVMEVLCTNETDLEPGRVIEITLAAPSL